MIELRIYLSPAPVSYAVQKEDKISDESDDQLENGVVEILTVIINLTNFTSFLNGFVVPCQLALLPAAYPLITILFSY